jgi:hypothetical protein
VYFLDLKFETPSHTDNLTHLFSNYLIILYLFFTTSHPIKCSGFILVSFCGNEQCKKEQDYGPFRYILLDESYAALYQNKLHDLILETLLVLFMYFCCNKYTRIWCIKIKTLVWYFVKGWCFITLNKNTKILLNSVFFKCTALICTNLLSSEFHSSSRDKWCRLFFIISYWIKTFCAINSWPDNFSNTSERLRLYWSSTLFQKISCV